MYCLMKNHILHLVLTLLLGCCTLREMHGQSLYTNYLDGNLYLKLQDTTSINLDPYANNIPAVNLILATFGVDSLYRAFSSGHPALQNIYRLEFSDIMGADNMIAQLELLSFVEYAEKVPLFLTTGSLSIPNDLQLSQWGLQKIQAPLAWDLATGNANVKVAIVDNAVRTSHEDLIQSIWVNPGETANNFLDDDLNGYIDDTKGYDVADFDNNVNPPLAISGWDHGSHCAGIAGAATDNGIGIASIGHGISIIPVKCSNDAFGGNTLSKAFEGVDYARAAGADVISMSWGSTGSSATGELILSLANNAGILLIAAAGNNGDSVPFYPAASSFCLAVGATDPFDVRASFSNYGSYVDLMAPGTDIYSCLAANDADYGSLSGTSMACPLVAGLAGLIQSAVPGITSSVLRTTLINGCENIDALNPGFAGKLGAGRINAFNCLLQTTNTTPSIPTDNVLLIPNPSHGLTRVQVPESWSQSPISVVVYDLRGTQHFSSNWMPSMIHSLPSDQWPDGIYFVKIQQSSQIAVVKLVLN